MRDDFPKEFLIIKNVLPRKKSPLQGLQKLQLKLQLEVTSKLKVKVTSTPKVKVEIPTTKDGRRRAPGGSTSPSNTEGSLIIRMKEPYFTSKRTIDVLLVNI